MITEYILQTYENGTKNTNILQIVSKGSKVSQILCCTFTIYIAEACYNDECLRGQFQAVFEFQDIPLGDITNTTAPTSRDSQQSVPNGLRVPIPTEVAKRHCNGKTRIFFVFSEAEIRPHSQRNLGDFFPIFFKKNSQSSKKK